MSISFKLEDYSYYLPDHLIAKYPPDERGASRLMVFNRADRSITHGHFSDLVRHLRPGDCLVLNDTRVFPARIRGRKDTGGAVEFLLLHFPVMHADGKAQARALFRSSKPMRSGCRVNCSEILDISILDILPDNQVELELVFHGDLETVLTLCGETPLPPYIKRDEAPSDRKDYQTVYARETGSVAAPTAGLHFTQDQLADIRERGIDIAWITLHIGYGTFAPIRASDIRRHRIHSEWLKMPQYTIDQIAATKARGGRVIAVGTTSVRALEAVSADGTPKAFEGMCDLYIVPGYGFKVVDAMITNFHLPHSSLLVLVSAFAGRLEILRVYDEAIKAGYKFYSYGDAMLIL
ncbi:MAG: tRNA preQ1(34) S-adenosylmethionine ribosyltransferase-isomerase QueA [Dissulfurimicrobium sp.]|uniref:tRNA preQ1(34) S-adenosylmethionine ribosyltransferase-isomerase QueA n=1 Tax=Dissulfurimicrobium sp. TaxID=2022436 RepID=UPI00404981CF